MDRLYQEMRKMVMSLVGYEQDVEARAIIATLDHFGVLVSLGKASPIIYYVDPDGTLKVNIMPADQAAFDEYLRGQVDLLLAKIGPQVEGEGLSA